MEKLTMSQIYKKESESFEFMKIILMKQMTLKVPITLKNTLCYNIFFNFKFTILIQLITLNY